MIKLIILAVSLIIVSCCRNSWYNVDAALHQKNKNSNKLFMPLLFLLLVIC